MILAASLASPAAAVDTTANFTVAAGALSVSAPATTTLGSGGSGQEISGPLGVVTVTDGRGSLTAAWTATASATSFTTGGGTPEETIPNSSVRYWSGLATSISGVGTFLPGQAAAINSVDLGASRTAFSLTAGSGTNQASWNPTVVVPVPANVVAGTYTGTVTHSVA